MQINLASDLWAFFWILMLSIFIAVFFVAAATLNDVYRHAIDERVALRENAKMLGVITAMVACVLLTLFASIK